MAPPSLRDRYSLAALAGGAGLGLLLGWGLLGAVGLALAALALRALAARPRRARPERIDPFTISEPWRHHVQGALQAHRRFTDAVEGARDGPLRDRLREIGDRVERGVHEVWRIACRGDELVEARRRIDPDTVRRQLGASGQAVAAGDATAERTLASLQAQLATAERLDRVIADTDSRLRLLEARLDEAAARSIELAARADDLAAIGGLGRDVDHMVDDMEALRQAIEEAGGAAAGPG